VFVRRADWVGRLLGGWWGVAVAGGGALLTWRLARYVTRGPRRPWFAGLRDVPRVSPSLACLPTLRAGAAVFALLAEHVVTLLAVPGAGVPLPARLRGSAAAGGRVCLACCDVGRADGMLGLICLSWCALLSRLAAGFAAVLFTRLFVSPAVRTVGLSRTWTGGGLLSRRAAGCS